MKLSDITNQYVTENYIQVWGQRSDGLDPLTLPDNTTLSTAIIDTHIANSAADLERLIGVFLSPKKVVTYPLTATQIAGMPKWGGNNYGEYPTDLNGNYVDQAQGVNFDILGTPLAYRRRESTGWIDLQLGHNNISAITAIKMLIGTQVIGAMPIDWVRITAAKEGRVQIIPTSGAAVTALTGIAPVFLGAWLVNDTLPAFWNVDYSTGLSDLDNAIVDYVCLRTAAIVLNLVATVSAQGVSNDSINFDGLSHSLTRNASSTFSLYSALLKQFDDLRTDFKKNGRLRYKGIRIIGL